MKSFKTLKPLRYTSDEIPAKKLKKSSKKMVKGHYEERIYGHKLTNKEKHDMIMGLVLERKKKNFEKIKKKGKIHEKKIKKKKKLEVKRKRWKLEDVKWRLKLSSLALETRKMQIEDNHWRIGELWRKKRRKDKAASKAKKKEIEPVFTREYSPKTKDRLQKQLKSHRKTNEYGLTKKQVKEFEKAQKAKNNSSQVEVVQEKMEDGSIKIVTKKLIKRYKRSARGSVDGEGGLDGEEGEEEAAEEGWKAEMRELLLTSCVRKDGTPEEAFCLNDLGAGVDHADFVYHAILDDEETAEMIFNGYKESEDELAFEESARKFLEAYKKKSDENDDEF